MKFRVLLLFWLFVQSAHAQVIDRIIAVVNAEVVTLSELESATETALTRASTVSNPVKRADARKRVLNDGLEALISERLVEQEAKKRKIVISEGDITDRISGMKNQQRWDDATFNRYLSSQGLTMLTLRKTIKKQLLNQRIVGQVLGNRVQVSETELRDYYREKVGQLGTEYEIAAAHILLKLPSSPTVADESAVRHRAREIVLRLRRGENFADLAKKYSEGPAAQRGGQLGMLRKGFLEPALETAFFALKVNQYSEPVRSSFGYHILTVSERRPIPVAAFEQVSAQLNQELQRKKIEGELAKWVATLRTKAFIDIRL